MWNELVQLVNEQDEEVGLMEKIQAHREGTLHRAFSIFLFDDSGRLLLQQRALGKYHSGGLWTNTCCSHPRPAEPLMKAAERRLKEEMGIIVPLEHRFSFRYKAEFPNGLKEHELDHVFFGYWSGAPEPDPSEVEAWAYVPMAELDSDLKRYPHRYSAWLLQCWERVNQEMKSTPRSTAQ